MSTRRREALLAGAGLLAAMLVRAQGAGKVHRIGFVLPTARGARHDAFLEGLRELGYVEGRNVRVEARFADGKPERLSALIHELIALDIEVLVVGATIGARAAKTATRTIPVVFAGSSDPVAGGVVSNLARPEANITGLSFAASEGFAGKWLELMVEAAPGASPIAALWSSSNTSASRFVADLRSAALALKVELAAHQAADLRQLDDALAAISASAARALIVTPSPFYLTQRRKLVEFAAARRLPSMYFVEEFVEAGGLMSYGPSIIETYRGAARYVDRILKGAKPSDLPVEQSDKFDLAVNLAAARALGLVIAPAMLLRANRVIGAI
ncbi:MAG TPA: ABC transporter substrate-binding protein [Burkholderiales bacterium]|nr:ABC transporter substrate-binding protein [Burkholderiales bacterium]